MSPLPCRGDLAALGVVGVDDYLSLDGLRKHLHECRPSRAPASAGWSVKLSSTRRGDQDQIPRKGIVCTVCDPCCGSRGMLIITKGHVTIGLRYVIGDAGPKELPPTGPSRPKTRPETCREAPGAAHQWSSQR